MTRANLAATIAILLGLAPSAHAQVRAQGRVVDANGAPVSGSAYAYQLGTGNAWRSVQTSKGPIAPANGAPLTLVGGSFGLVGSSHPMGAGYFDVPSKLPVGTYSLHVHHDQKEEWAWPYVVPAGGVTDVPMVRIGGPPPSVPQGSGRPLPPLFTPQRLNLGFSYYNALGVSPEVRASDFQRLSEADLDAIEIWLIWPRTPGTDVLDSHGNWLPGGQSRFKTLLDQAQSYGLYVDTRVSACNLYRTGDHDSESQKQVVRSMAQFADHPALLGLDVSNEAENQQKGPTTGGTGWCHTSKGEFAAISQLAKQVAPKLRVTVSISGPPDGPIDESAGVTPSGTWYCTTIDAGAVLAFAAPHDPRTKTSGTATEDFVRRERAALGKCDASNLPIALVEPFRDNHTPPNYAFPLSQYEAAVKGARKAAAAYWCLHDGPNANVVGKNVWYDPTKPTIDQLDDTQRQALAHAREWAK